MLLSCYCQCLIDVPTRVTKTSKTLIHHVITNDKQRTVTAGVSILDLSDHYEVLAILSYNNIKGKISNQRFMRDMTKGGQYRVEKYRGTFLVSLPVATVLFQKRYRSTGTAVLFEKSFLYFQFFITYRLKIKLFSLSFWIRANKFLTPKYSVTVHSKERFKVCLPTIKM